MIMNIIFIYERAHSRYSVTTKSDGTAYFSSNANDAPMRACSEKKHGVDPYSLRIRSKHEGFDPEYRLAFADAITRPSNYFIEDTRSGFYNQIVDAPCATPG